jgi:ubiquinone biosynthesis protein
MRITDVYVGYLKITRIIQIGSILVKHGFKEMISHTFLGRRIRKRRIRQHKPVYTTQERLRLTIEDLGPTYIKFGQILAGYTLRTVQKRIEEITDQCPPFRRPSGDPPD